MRPRWRSVGRRRPTTHRLRPKRSGGRRRRDFVVSRGMGETQGKKVVTRRCGIGGRGEAGLRPDQAIGEAVRCARSTGQMKETHGDISRSAREQDRRFTSIVASCRTGRLCSLPCPAHHRTSPSPVFGFCRRSCSPLVEASLRVRALGHGSDPSLLRNTYAILAGGDGVYPCCSGVAAHGVEAV